MKKTVITIARSYVSGGRTLGKLLAEELGINCYDREILRMASDDSGINEALFGQTDEKLKKSPLFRIARKNPYKGGVIPPESADFVSDDNLFNYQAKVIRELAEEERKWQYYRNKSAQRYHKRRNAHAKPFQRT